jgi:hypothetical protein
MFFSVSNSWRSGDRIVYYHQLWMAGSFFAN